MDRDLLFRYLEIVRDKPKPARRSLPPLATTAHPLHRSLPPHLGQLYEVPPEWIERIIRLDAVFKRVHRFRAVPADWIAASVSKAVINAEQRRRAKKARRRSVGVSTSDTAPEITRLEVDLMKSAFGSRRTDPEPMKTASEEVAAFLKRKRYLKADRYEKSDLIVQAMANFGVCRRTVFNAAMCLRQQSEKS